MLKKEIYELYKNIIPLKYRKNFITYVLFVNKDKAIAVPITSCMSLPIIAISIIIHKIILGIFLYCL